MPPPGTSAAAAAYSDVGWIPFVLVPATVLLLLFPDGQRFVARSAIAGIVLGLLTGGATSLFRTTRP
jgi:hypothetical protein